MQAEEDCSTCTIPCKRLQRAPGLCSNDTNAGTAAQKDADLLLRGIVATDNYAQLILEGHGHRKIVHFEALRATQGQSMHWRGGEVTQTKVAFRMQPWAVASLSTTTKDVKRRSAKKHPKLCNVPIDLPTMHTNPVDRGNISVA